MSPTPVAASFLCVLATAVAQAPVLPMTPFHGVFVSPVQEDGSVWVRGDRYKVGLAAEVTFQPLLGPRSPRDWPLQLQWQGPATTAAPAPWQMGERSAERRSGNCVERWDFAPERAQQSFRFEKPMEPGDLVCTLAVTTDLHPEPDGPGVTFLAPEGRGGVHYSDAVVVDAAGERLDVPVEWAGGALRIVVPASFVAAAHWPITVDPWLQTIVVDATASDLQGARAAYDETNDVWFLIAEEVLSATDSDIRSWRYSAGPGAPVLLDTGFEASTSNRTIHPDVANVGESALFVTAWYDITNVGLGSGQVRYSRRLASSSSTGTALTLSSGVGTDPGNRVFVGGSQTGSLFVIASMRSTPTSAPVIQARSVDVGGQTYGTHQVTLPLMAAPPTIDLSARQGASDPWVVLWQECSGTCSTTQIVAQALFAPQNAGGFTVQPPIVVASGSPDFAPRIAGSAGRWLAVWQRNTFRGAASLVGRPLSVSSGLLGTLGTEVDMHAGEPNSVPATRRLAPAISYDGVRYVVTYDEQGPSGTEPYSMTVVVDAAGNVAWHDGHVSFGLGQGVGNGALDAAASSGAHLGRHFVALQRPTANGDLLAATIDAYAAGSLSSVANIGCGLPSEPTISLSGTPALGRTFTVSLGNLTGVPFLLTGLPAITPLPGCGSCQQGVSLAGAVTQFGASTTIVVPTSPSFLHLPIGFQGLTMLQAGGCPAAVFGVGFALSDLLQVEIL